jgi:hypothetical protein
VTFAKEKFESETRKEMFSMDKPHQVTPDIEVLPAHFAIPGMGFFPVNAFVFKAAELVLVDTGMGMDSEEFMKALDEHFLDNRIYRCVSLVRIPQPCIKRSHK